MIHEQIRLFFKRKHFAAFGQLCPGLEQKHLALRRICYPVKIALGNFGTGFLRLRKEFFIHVRRNPVVGFDNPDIFSPCPGDSGVHCFSVAAVRLMNCHDARVLRRIFVNHLRTTVPGTVVYQNDFHVFESLIQNAVHALLQILFHPVNRNHNRNIRLHYFSPFWQKPRQTKPEHGLPPYPCHNTYNHPAVPENKRF